MKKSYTNHFSIFDKFKGPWRAIPVVGLGAGGHARVLIEAIRSEGKYQIAFMLDRDLNLIGQDFFGVSILGTDAMLPEVAQKIHRFFVGLGSIGWASHRVRLFEQALAHKMQPISIIHPSAIISKSAVLSEGVIILAATVINPCAKIGTNVIVNTGVIVEHDAVIGDHVHLATGARICGSVEIGNEAHIGAGSTIIQGVKVGSSSIIGAGAVVLHDIPSGVVAVGVPAKIIRSLSE